MFEQDLERLKREHLLRRLTVLNAESGPIVTAAGERLLLMCSNDYLGLSTHPALSQATRAALDKYGCGAGASRLVSGTTALHAELELRIARFKGTEAALLFNSGYAANTGIIPAIAGPGDLILSDSLNHASIIDGCRLSKARTEIYRHCDLYDLERLLQSSSGTNRTLIVTDGVFSMDGDLAPLPGLVSLADRYNVLLMVDDAHATGVLGRTGRGSAEHFGLEGRIPIQMGTLGKALGSFGAYAAGSRDLIDLLVNQARSFMFSTALPPSICAASIAALAIVEQESGFKNKLWENREYFVGGLHAIGIDTGRSETMIVPLVVGKSETAAALSEKLFDEGIYATAIRPPTVPEGSARIRMTVMASHSREDLDRVIRILSRLKQEGCL
ncbi:MAG: 8-amino-7-oxononanoate synthase [Nitrospirae bacterium GWD2_57_9]|nr:MAG: 8-amino-7-oxononanoate synthase [Nitrospirae bacterium GWD2_57_9]OGW47289.1 MAG: 8-amino-7-oxononanoate synthase [Nitrospirae bacterium GWC2_57_9]